MGLIKVPTSGCWNPNLAETITNKTINAVSNSFSYIIQTPESKKFSAMYFLTGTASVGLINAVTAAVGQASAGGSIDNNGRQIVFTTGTTSGNNAGSQNSSSITCRAMNPRLRFKFKLGQTDANFRFYFGWKGTSITDPSGDDPLNGASGFMVGVVTTNNTNFVVMSNDGTGATSITATSTPIDTSIHILDIVAEDANGRWGYAFDNAALTYISTDIPATLTNLGIGLEVQTATTAAKTFTAYWLWHEQDQ